MSKPLFAGSLDGVGFRAILNRAVSEIVSGMSSLNMMPNPIPDQEQQSDSIGFLSDTDYNVQHALEHLQAAVQVISAAQKTWDKEIESARRSPRGFSYIHY